MHTFVIREVHFHVSRCAAVLSCGRTQHAHIFLVHTMCSGFWVVRLWPLMQYLAAIGHCFATLASISVVRNAEPPLPTNYCYHFAVFSILLSFLSCQRERQCRYLTMRNNLYLIRTQINCIISKTLRDKCFPWASKCARESKFASYGLCVNRNYLCKLER